MIHNGRPDDIGAISHVRTSVTENHLSTEQLAEIGITPHSILEDIAAGQLGRWVAEVEGAVLTFAMAGKPDGSVFALFALPGHEGKGVGSALLACCESWLKQQGHATAKLDTGRESKAYDFYLHRGWRPTGETAGHFAVDHVLIKDL